MIRLAKAAVAVIGVIFLAATARAAPVNEQELANQATNNTRAAAQRIFSSNFGRNDSPGVYGHKPTASITGHIYGGDVDWYLVEGAPGPAYFDLDSPGSSFADTSMALFNSAGTLLAFGTDGFASGGVNDPGSRDLFDPFLGVYTVPSTGIYYIAVTERPAVAQTPNGFISPGAPLVRPDGRNSGSFLVNARPGVDTFPTSAPQPPIADLNGTYTLHISGNFATFGDLVSLRQIGIWGSALGGAGVTGGVDVRLTNANQADHLLSITKLTDPATLPPFVDFFSAGPMLQAWNVQKLSFASDIRGAEMYFGYDEAAILAAGIRESDLMIFHHDGSRWIGGGTVNAADNEIFFAATSVSPFVLGVVPEPSSVALLAIAGLVAWLLRVARWRRCSL